MTRKSGGGDRGGSGGGSGSDRTTGGARREAVRVRQTGKRTASSMRWLQRQLNDPYVAEAQRLGYRSRAAFKLIQLDDRFHFLKPGLRVVDLGAAPGGWTQIAVTRVKADRPDGGKVVGLDILEMGAIAHATVMQGDFNDPEVPDRLKAVLGGPVDIVLTDMAAPTVGHSRTDHLRIIGLAEAALTFAEDVLKPGGAFIAKLFQGGAEKDLHDRLKRAFKQVRHAKPAASRADSAETYIIAMGFRGRDAVFADDPED